MRERPILFSAPMVRAILDGAKTQTRRIVKGMALDWLGQAMFTPEYVALPENDMCPHGKAGDRLWVREAFSGPHDYDEEKWPPRAWFTDDPIWYWADGNPATGDWTRPKPSIHMPRWASRISLEITDVRLQRLQEISGPDAWAEGIPHSPDVNPVHGFEELWQSINGHDSWNANPWVWALTFNRTSATTDGPEG